MICQRLAGVTEWHALTFTCIGMLFLQLVKKTIYNEDEHGCNAMHKKTGFQVLSTLLMTVYTRLTLP